MSTHKPPLPDRSKTAAARSRRLEQLSTEPDIQHRVVRVPQDIAGAGATTPLDLPKEIWLYESAEAVVVYRDGYRHLFDHLVDLAGTHGIDYEAARALAYEGTCYHCRLALEPHQCGVAEVEARWVYSDGDLSFNTYEICRDCLAKASYRAIE
jgi:hypothetical protein